MIGQVKSHQQEVIEHALAHQLVDKIEAICQRETRWPKRVALMDSCKKNRSLPHQGISF
ncbi:Hypothetical protein Y17_3429 [Pectobacterium wasabiae CFBP 3304]|nr:Hypothetical protein Y17_3429 [Pectobacterium wasabiae CFBP 3304]